MNQPTTRCLKFLGIGGACGLVVLLVFLFSGLMVRKGTSLDALFTLLFETINKPLELIPLTEFLAQRQDPILTLAFMAVYWVMLGVLTGALAFAVIAWRQKIK
jgi:hypothetical protein